LSGVFPLFVICAPFMSFEGGIRTLIFLTYISLLLVNRIVSANQARFSPAIAGTCFIIINAVSALLWYWKVWPHWKPDCTIKPSWTAIFG
jgi:hypothetical protein